MMKLLVMIMSLAILTGCQSVHKGTQGFKNLLGKKDNGSLDYMSAKKLPPVQLPAQKSNIEFVPLYAVPNVPKNTLNLTNEAGKQYRLPKPPKINAQR